MMRYDVRIWFFIRLKIWHVGSLITCQVRSVVGGVTCCPVLPKKKARVFSKRYKNAVSHAYVGLWSQKKKWAHKTQLYLLQTAYQPWHDKIAHLRLVCDFLHTVPSYSEFTCLPRWNQASSQNSKCEVYLSFSCSAWRYRFTKFSLDARLMSEEFNYRCFVWIQNWRVFCVLLENFAYF